MIIPNSHIFSSISAKSRSSSCSQPLSEPSEPQSGQYEYSYMRKVTMNPFGSLLFLRERPYLVNHRKMSSNGTRFWVSPWSEYSSNRFMVRLRRFGAARLLHVCKKGALMTIVAASSNLSRATNFEKLGILRVGCKRYSPRHISPPTKSSVC